MSDSVSLVVYDRDIAELIRVDLLESGVAITVQEPGQSVADSFI